MERSLEEVENIREFAKLDRSDLKPVVQCIHFGSSLENDSYSLLEVDAAILKDIEAGERLIVRGEKSDSAVLCTGERTYDLRCAETSNSLLLLPEVQMPGTMDQENISITQNVVLAVKHEYYELRSTKPKMRRLKELLQENVYSGPECEDDEEHQGKKYTFDELLDHVQASQEELRAGIQSLQAVQFQGFVRLLDFDFMWKVMNHIVSLTDEQSWGYDAVPYDECCNILEDLYPRDIVSHVLQHITEPVENGEGERTRKLNEDAICRFYAELILKPTEKFNLSEFLEAWQLAVPEGMKTGLYQLEGVALVMRDSNPEVIKYFPVHDLPEDVNERFSHLFKTKQKWTFDEISPFVKDLATAKLSVSALLTKFARASTQDGIKVYSSKKQIS